MKTTASLIALAALVVALAGSARALDVGDRAPDVAGGAWRNHPATSLSDLRGGHVVLVEFWRTW